MKAIAICGSPRIEGNTEVLLTKCCQVLEREGIETTLVRLAEKLIKPCDACGSCGLTKDSACGVKDDDFHEVFDQMVAADIIVVGSPVYYGSATPNLMALLDRAGFVAMQNRHLFSRKIGGPISVGRRAGQTFTVAQLALWYLINDMIVPGSSYWNVAQGNRKGDVVDDNEGMATVERFGENLAWLARKIAAAPAGE